MVLLNRIYTSPALFVLTLFTSILIVMGMGEAPPPAGSGPGEDALTGSKDQKPPTTSNPLDLSGETHLKYTTLSGYFQQDETNTDAASFKYNESNFGLINRSYDTDTAFDPDGKKTQWQRFEYHLSSLNKNAEAGTGMKLFFLGRHGEGVHNVAEAKFGTKVWDCYWSLQDGKDGQIWADAHLTTKGILQATLASSTFHTAVKNGLMPYPQSYYVSPLWRCLETADITFRALQDELPADRPYKPVIKELFRETIGAHTCDRRSRKSELTPLWVERGYVFEGGFKEEDELWRARLRETDEAIDERSEKVLDEVWKEDKNEWISVTAHSGMIASLLRAVSHRKFALETGGVIPVLMKMEKAPGKRPVREGEKFTTVTQCAKPTTPTKQVMI